MIAALGTALAGGWAWAVGIGWLLPAAAGAVSGVAAGWFGHDWLLALLVAGGTAGFVFILARFGLKKALIWAGGVAAAVLYRLGEVRGAARQASKEKADAERRARARERTIEDVHAASDDDLHRRARRWMRDDG